MSRWGTVQGVKALAGCCCSIFTGAVGYSSVWELLPASGTMPVILGSIGTLHNCLVVQVLAFVLHAAGVHRLHQSEGLLYHFVI
jgi:hypothetical protein